MSERLEQATGQRMPKQPSKDPRPAASRIEGDRPKRAKPTGAVTYTIEKGANVWPWQRKA